MTGQGLPGHMRGELRKGLGRNVTQIQRLRFGRVQLTPILSKRTRHRRLMRVETSSNSQSVCGSPWLPIIVRCQPIAGVPYG